VECPAAVHAGVPQEEGHDPGVDPAAFEGRACRQAFEEAAKILSWRSGRAAEELDHFQAAMARLGRPPEARPYDHRIEIAALCLEHPRVDPALLDPAEFAALRAEPRIAEAMARRR
jgi:hypothetical protein